MKTLCNFPWRDLCNFATIFSWIGVKSGQFMVKQNEVSTCRQENSSKVCVNYVTIQYPDWKLWPSNKGCVFTSLHNIIIIEDKWPISMSSLNVQHCFVPSSRIKFWPTLKQSCYSSTPHSTPTIMAATMISASRMQHIFLRLYWNIEEKKQKILTKRGNWSRYLCCSVDQPARPSKSHRFWPFCAGKCPFFLISLSWGKI